MVAMCIGYDDKAGVRLRIQMSMQCQALLLQIYGLHGMVFVADGSTASRLATLLLVCR